MENLFIGIDVSKDVLDYAAVDQDNREVFRDKKCLNDEKGLKELIKSLKEYSNYYQLWVCLEHTGHFGGLACFYLEKENIPYFLLNPMEVKRSMGIVRGKTDSADALRIAHYGASNTHKLVPFTLPGKTLGKLKILFSIRARYVKIATQLKNGLKACEILHRTTPIKKELEEQRKLIDILDKKIAAIERRMFSEIQTESKLLKTFSKITQVVGVGPITALKCIIETDNFTRFSDPRKFNCHCGLAPFPYRSGSSIRGRTKTSKLRDKELKAILFKAAGSAIQHDHQLKAYYKRKISEGKNKLSVLNAVANKIVLRIFAVAKREEPFVKLSA
jgi:transposase